VESIRTALAHATINPEYADVLKPPTRTKRLVKKSFELYCKFLFRYYCPVAVSGRENIPDTSFIFCSNHCSHMDSALLMAASGLPFEKFGMVAAMDYFFDNRRRKVFLGLLMDLIPVDRNPNYKKIIELIVACREFLKTSVRNLIIFPEGTRSIDGKMQSFKKGPAMIATELNLPIVPAYINGSFAAWPKGRVFMKRTRITMRIGEPIYSEAFAHAIVNGRANRAYRLLTEKLEVSVRQLMEVDGRGV
jgi:long-chain acyl-CoA synthetase